MLTVLFNKLEVGKRYCVQHRKVNVMNSEYPPKIEAMMTMQEVIALMEKEILAEMFIGDTFSVSGISVKHSKPQSIFYKVEFNGVTGYVNSIALAPTVEEVQ
jgi:hypothetical protein